MTLLFSSYYCIQTPEKMNISFCTPLLVYTLNGGEKFFAIQILICLELKMAMFGVCYRKMLTNVSFVILTLLAIIVSFFCFFAWMRNTSFFFWDDFFSRSVSCRCTFRSESRKIYYIWYIGLCKRKLFCFVLNEELSEKIVQLENTLRFHSESTLQLT